MSALLEQQFGGANERTLQYVNVLSTIEPLSGTVIEEQRLPGFLKKHVGKVRDTYECDDCLVLVTTDRQSAFDRQLTQVPCKGQVRNLYITKPFSCFNHISSQHITSHYITSPKQQILNLISLWWFNRTSHIVPNHVIASPHPNVLIAKKCVVFPVEFVMRGYVTGSTSTSLWTNYNKGVRNYCGHNLPEGLIKNQKLEKNLLTPTTKSEHDELISVEEIVNTGPFNLSSTISSHVLNSFTKSLLPFLQQD